MALFFRGMGITVTQIGLLMMVQSSGWAIFEPVFGIVADRLGKKRLMIYSVITTSIIYVSYTFASSIWHLYLIMFAMSSNMAAGAVSGRAMIVELIPASRRGRTYGRYMAALSMGSVFGPIIGGFLTEAVGYAAPFYFCGVLGLLGLVAIFPMRYEERVGKMKSIAVTASNRSSLMARPFLSLLILRLLYMFNMNFQRNTLPIFLHESPSFRASETQIGFYMGLIRFTSAISQIFLGSLSDKVGYKKLIVSGLAMGGLSYLSMFHISGALPLYLLGSVQGVFFAATDMSMMIYLMTTIPEGSTGKAMGFYGLSEDVGGMIASPSLGIVYDRIGPLPSVAFISTILMCNGALSLLLVKKDEQSTGDGERGGATGG